MSKELTELIEDLRLNHEYCPKEVILQAADYLEILSKPEQDYNRGYADAMNWKVQNHLEHWPPKEPEQEPVAYIRVSKTGHVMACAKTGDFYSLPHKTLLYTTPPQHIPQAVPQIPQEDSSNESAYQRGYLDGMAKRPQPLTDEQINRIAKNYALNNPTTPLHFARAIEAAHGIKGEA